MKKIIQNNIVMNNLYDTRLCYTHTVQCHTDHSLQCWSEVFVFLNFTKMFVRYYCCVCISQARFLAHLVY